MLHIEHMCCVVVVKTTGFLQGERSGSELRLDSVTANIKTSS